MGFRDTNTSPIRREIPGIVTGVGASNMMVLKVPPNATYAQLEARMTIAGVAPTRVQMEAMLGEVRVLIGGRLVEVLSAKQMIALAEFYNTGEIADLGVLTWDFQRLWMQGLLAQNQPEWGTLAEGSFEIQIDQAAASTIDLVRVYATFETNAEELGAYIRRVRVSPPITATGHVFIQNLPRFADSFLYAIHFETSVAANIDSIRAEFDGVEVLNLPVLMINRHYNLATPRRTIQNAGRVDSNGATSGFVHLDFCWRNYDSDAIKMNYDAFTLDLNFINAAPTLFNVIMEIGSVEPSKIKK